MVEKLALHGGRKAFDEDIDRYNTIGSEEILAVTRVVESGNLSQYLGEKDPDFLGGPTVQEFERRWSEYFKIKHSVSVNSCTSGLIAALGAVGIEPGDEVILSPMTMTATGTAILVWNAIPVFADIEIETFNLDPDSVERNISPYTKAIIVTNIFGHPASLKEIMALATKHKLLVIEDNAQSPGATFHGKFAGTISDIGVFSLNYHKHIHTGEGGVCVTDNDKFAKRLQLIRNHGEAVADFQEATDLANIIGFNFRLGEMEAAIGLEQLKKLPTLLEEKIKWANVLDKRLSQLKGLRVPIVKEECSHVYYCYPILIDKSITRVSRDNIFEALLSEGIPLLAKNYSLIHLLSIYQRKIAYGTSGFPWTADFYKGEASYEFGICPVAETLMNESYINIGLSMGEFSEARLEKVANAFEKVWENLVS